MRSVALPEPLCTADANTSSARSMLDDEINQLADSKLCLLLDDVLDTDGIGSAVGPIGRSCRCGTSDLRSLTALSAGATVAPGGWHGQSFFHKSLPWSPRHGVTACVCIVGAGVGTGVLDAKTPSSCCGVVAAATVMTLGSAAVMER